MIPGGIISCSRHHKLPAGFMTTNPLESPSESTQLSSSVPAT